MKKFYITILAITLICLNIGCSLKKSDNPEIRFVDLKGNARPIKTRIPEANAKIIYGQGSDQNNDNKKNIAPDVLYDQDQNLSKNYTENNPENSAENSNLNEYYKPKYSKNLNNSQNSIVEYDLSKEFEQNNSEVVSQQKAESAANQNLPESEDQNISENSPNQNFASDENNNIITYSTKNFKRNGKNNSNISNPSNISTDAKDVEDKSNLELQENPVQKIANDNFNKSSTKYYVQIGSFNNYNSAKKRLNKIKNYGKGDVISAYINKKKVYRSVFGPYNSRSKANNIKNRIVKSGNDAIVIRGK